MSASNNNKAIESITIQYDYMDGVWIATTSITIKSGDKVAWNKMVKAENGRLKSIVLAAMASKQTTYVSGSTFVTVTFNN